MTKTLLAATLALALPFSAHAIDLKLDEATKGVKVKTDMGDVSAGGKGAKLKNGDTEVSADGKGGSNLKHKGMKVENDDKATKLKAGDTELLKKSKISLPGQ